jgi:multicomponent Na+:H+ antiporter subunit G
MTVRDTIAAVLMVAGALLMLLAALGLIRLPDVLLRLSASSKAATLGAACILFAAAEDLESVGATTRALAALLFLMLTVPVGSHLLGRAAYRAGDPLFERTEIDELGSARPPRLPDATAPPPDHDGSPPDDGETSPDHTALQSSET